MSFQSRQIGSQESVFAGAVASPHQNSWVIQYAECNSLYFSAATELYLQLFFKSCSSPDKVSNDNKMVLMS